MPEYTATINLVARDQTGPTISQVSSKISGLGSVAGDALGAVGKSVGGVVSSMATVSAAGAGALTAFGVGAFGAAARVGELNATLKALAAANNVSYESLQQATASVKGMGIETASAQGLVAQFTSNQLDLSKAGQLARVAQDAAVIGQVNSTEALDSLVHGILTQNTEVLRNVGINIDAAKAQSDYAKSIGVSTKELTASQKQTAILNAVLQKGESISGAYAAAMEEPGKVLRSFPRLFKNIEESVGVGLVDAFGPLILQAYKLVGAFAAAAESGKLQPVFDAIAAGARAIAVPLGKVVDWLTNFLKNLDTSQVQGFVGMLGKFAPVLAPIVGYLVALGGANILGALGPLGAIFGALGISISPVAVAIAALVIAFPPLRNAAMALAGVLMSTLGAAFQTIGPIIMGIVDFVSALFMAFTEDPGALGVVYDLILQAFGPEVAGFFQPLLQNLMDFLNGTDQLRGPLGMLAAGFQFLGDVVGVVVGIFQAIGGAISAVTGFVQEHTAVQAILVGAITAVVGILTLLNLQMAIAGAVQTAQMVPMLLWIAQLWVSTAATTAWSVAQGILNAVLSANPIGLVVIAIAALAAGLIYAYNNSETFRNAVNGLWTWIQNLASTISGALQPALSTAGTSFQNIGNWVSNAATQIGNLIQKFKDLLGPIGNAADAIKNLPGLGGTGGNQIGSIGNIPITFGGAFQEGGWLREPVAGIGLNTGQTYTLAEAGPEYVMPAGGMGAGIGGGLNVSGPITVTVNGATGPAETWANAADAIFDELYARVSRGLGNRPLGAGRGAY